jgi:4-amino-4-deoxy-L-arabinose transferase-like glycosyltransferase
LYGLAAAAVLALQVATSGLCGPWDPWETHYGEVARQILVRGDPLDLWWKPGLGPDGNLENTFWSKPALPFWLMALSMALFGVGAAEAADELVRGPWVELAIRLPSLLVGWLSAIFLGVMVCRLGQVRAATPQARRLAADAGALTALILATTPQWAIVSRQALCDMFFVGPVTLAMGAWALAYLQPDRLLARRQRELVLRRRRVILAFPWDRAYLAFLVLFALAVLIPLAALDHHVLSDLTRRKVAGFVKRPDVPNLYTLWQIHAHLLGYWALAALALLLSLRWRSRSDAWMGILYLAAGLSLLGKGLIGPGLIGLLVLSDLLVRGRLRLLRRCGLPLGVLLFVLASFPWHHAMVLYRGDRFLSELIVVNNLARFSSGEQQQAVGDFTYYLRTLGAAALPWIAALPAALWLALSAPQGRAPAAPPSEPLAAPPGPPEAAASALTASSSATPVNAASSSRSGAASLSLGDPRGELMRFALLWFAVSLLLLTYSATKYYHYLLPALPPFAVLIGLALTAPQDPAGRAWLLRRPRARVVAAALGLCLLGLALRDLHHEPAWIAHLTTYLYTGMWREGALPTAPLLWLLAPLTLALIAWSALRPRLAIACGLLAALPLAAWLFGAYLPHASESWSQRSAIRRYYDRRAEGDRLVSFWFYYRGETYLTKGTVWMIKEAKRERLIELIEAERGRAAALWLITTRSHAKRAITMLPRELQAAAEWAYESPHYALLRIPLPEPQGLPEP